MVKNPEQNIFFTTERENTENQIEIPSGRTAYFNYLLSQQENPEPFPHSSGQENPSCALEPAESLGEYENVLKGYASVENVDRKKCDFGTENSPNSGYKIHLNVAKKDVKAVSEYLRREGFSHKYLSGGEPVDGKVFTVYAGSKEMVGKISNEIANAVGDKLRKPVNIDEIEFAPNIVGRFDMQDSKFHRLGLGLRGLSMRMEDVRGIIRQRDLSDDDRKKKLKQAFEKSYNEIADIFGSYFYG